MDGTFILMLIGTAISTLALAAGGLWAYNEAVKKQFDEMNREAKESNKTLFRRMDENHEEYYKNFVKKELYDAELRHQEERNNDKFISVRSLFETMFKGLEQKIDQLSDKIKEGKSHDKQNV